MRKGITPEQAAEIRAKKGIVETNLQRIRVEKGMSQQALAESAGVTRRMIEAYEQRTRSIDNAKLQTLCDLCLVLECSIGDIIESNELYDLLTKVKPTE